MTYTLTRAVTVTLVIMFLHVTPATGGGRRATFPAGPAGAATQADGVLLRDSFDRADFPELGAPWLEAGEVEAEYVTAQGYRVGTARTGVSQGALSFRYVSHSQKPQFPFTSVNGRPVVYAPLARGVSARPAVLSFTFEPHPDDRVAHEAGLMSAAGGFRQVGDASGVNNYTPADGLAVSFGRSSSAYDNSQVSIIRYEDGARTVLAEKALGFQFASGKTYTVSLTVVPGCSATVQVSDGVSTNQVTSPGTAVAFPLDQFFIADVEGGISSDTRGAGDYSLRFDDVSVLELAAAPPPQRRPLIFIPGIAGSRLDNVDNKKIWPPPDTEKFANQFSEVGFPRLSLDPNQSPFFPPADIIVPDVIRFYEQAQPGEGDVYGSVLAALTDGGYREYVVDGKQERRTYDGCHLCQQPNNPTLFVFAYDWRRSNTEAAAALREYVRCIRKFYPGTDVDIVAHSQGGLVARRYILDHPGDHHVAKLITVASPWLGAPKAINVLETGRFLDRSSVIKDAIRNQIFKTLSEFYPGVHELVPSQSYFDAGGTSPYGYLGQPLTYSQVADILDQQFPMSKPGTANRAFHGNVGQDDWSQDQSGVEYHHLYGVKGTVDTVGRVVPREDVLLGPSSDAHRHTLFDIVLTSGDGTVPLVSARRTPALNAPGVSVASGRIKGFIEASSCDGGTHPVEHAGLMRNPCVIAEILTRLQTSPPPLTGGATDATAAAAGPEEFEARPAYYLRVIGAATAAVRDGQGNTNNPLADPADNNVPDVTSYVLGARAFLTIIPVGQSYTVTLQSGAGPMRVELTQGDEAVTSATRYQDLMLPAGVFARIQITPEGADVLRYDGDGDGTFETGVTPTVEVTGDVARDGEPPVVTSSMTLGQLGALVTIAATDSGSGVKKIYYSTDGVNFQVYTGPVRYDSPGNHVIQAFAEDNAANRSGLSSFMVSVPQKTRPVVDAGPDRSAAEDVAFTLAASFTDADPSDTHTATVNWGDGSPAEAATVTEPSGPNPGVVNAVHTYLAPGTYIVTLTVTDTANNSHSDTLQLAVGACSPANVALVSAGASATASSSYPNGNFPTAAAIDGDRKGTSWGAGGGWNDGTRDVGPDWLQVEFGGARRISEIRVFTLQDSFSSPVEPTPTIQMSLYGLKDYEVQYWDGAQWVTGGSVTNNNLVWRTFTLPGVTTTKVRVLVPVGGWRAYFSRVTEIEVMGCMAP